MKNISRLKNDIFVLVSLFFSHSDSLFSEDESVELLLLLLLLFVERFASYPSAYSAIALC